MDNEYISIKLNKKDIIDFGDEIRSILQIDNIHKGQNYERVFYRELEDGNSLTTKLKYNINTISFNQFKKVVNECLSDVKYKYYFPGVSILNEKDKEILNDAFLIEDNTIKIVELKKNLSQIDTGKSDNVYDRIVIVKRLLEKDLDVDIHPLIVGIENEETDKLYRLQTYCETDELITGRDFLNKLGLDYDKIYNIVYNLNLKDVIDDITNIFYKYNNK